MHRGEIGNIVKGKAYVMATVALVGTLDTKGEEYQFVKECIIDSGCDVLLIDTGILGTPAIKADISSAEVMKRGGKDINEFRSANESGNTRATAIETMSECLTKTLMELIKDHKIDAVFGMGGSGGTNLISGAMRSLPLGFPKLLLSTMMSGNVKPYIGGRDIAMMYSVTDIAGLNRFSRIIMSNAANAAVGMAKHYNNALQKEANDKKPLVGITMFGITTPGVLHMRDLLEQKGFETIVFHATGAGGMAMESMIREGLIDGVIDYTTTELCDYELGGVFSAGPDRLTAAGEKGIPQVVCPGALECLNFNGVDNLPEKYNVPERKLIIHNPTVCAVKATPDELVHLGTVLAEKVNAARENAEIVLPLDGLDSYEDGKWKDHETDHVLFDNIKKAAKVPVHEFKGTINNPEFAEKTVGVFLKLWKTSHGSN